MCDGSSGVCWEEWCVVVAVVSAGRSGVWWWSGVCWEEWCVVVEWCLLGGVVCGGSSGVWWEKWCAVVSVVCVRSPYIVVCL